MIVFVGSNPSVASGTNRPFDDDTRSYKVLWSWISQAGLFNTISVIYYNVSNKPTPNNRPLNKTEINQSIARIKSDLSGYTKIVALGKTAHIALELAGVPHLAIGHPSGLNRKLNDPNYVKDCIDRLREYAK